MEPDQIKSPQSPSKRRKQKLRKKASNFVSSTAGEVSSQPGNREEVFESPKRKKRKNPLSEVNPSSSLTKTRAFVPRPIGASQNNTTVLMPLEKQATPTATKMFASTSSGIGTDSTSEIAGKFNTTFGIVNSLIALLLLFMGLFAFYLTVENGAENLLCIGVSVQKLDGLECAHKYLCFFISCLLLFPYLMESVIAVNLFVGGRLQTLDRAEEVLETVTQWTVQETIESVLSSLAYLLTAMILAFPMIVILPFSQDARNTWKAFPFVVPTLLLNLSLMPFTFILIFSADNPAETMVETMGIQIFAAVSNVFVRQLFSPETQLAATLSLFFPRYNFYKQKSLR